MKLFERYKFTDKKHGAIGIMSSILGVIALISSVLSAILPYLTKASSTGKYGMAMLLSLFFAIIGIVLAIIGKISSRAFDFFPKLGLIVNGLVIVFVVFIIYQGK